MYQFWIASHISSESRKKTLPCAIDSAAKQDIPPDRVHIYLSYSYKTEVLKDPEVFEESLKLLSDRLTILRSEERLLQFEHLHKIHTLVEETVPNRKNLFIAFCDDDDLNHPSRLSRCPTRGVKVFYSKSIVFYDHDSEIKSWSDMMTHSADTIVNREPDFGSMIVHYSLVRLFFEKHYHTAVTQLKGMADVFFKVFIEGQSRPALSDEIGYASRFSFKVPREYGVV